MTAKSKKVRNIAEMSRKGLAREVRKLRKDVKLAETSYDRMCHSARNRQDTIQRLEREVSALEQSNKVSSALARDHAIATQRAAGEAIGLTRMAHIMQGHNLIADERDRQEKLGHVTTSSHTSLDPNQVGRSRV